MLILLHNTKISLLTTSHRITTKQTTNSFMDNQINFNRSRLKARVEEGKDFNDYNDNSMF